MHTDDDGPPVEGYEGLPARDAMRLLRDLSRVTLERLYSWEDLHLRRTVVLRAIKRAIDRHDVQPPPPPAKKPRQKVGT